MPTPNNHALVVETRTAPVAIHSACPDAERIDPIDPIEWPSLDESMSPVARRPNSASPPASTSLHPAEVSMPNPSVVKANMADEPDNKTDSDLCLSPEPSATEVKQSTPPLPRDSEVTYLSRDPNPAATTYAGLLPPLPRPRYTSSYLRPGSRFVGKQQSDKQVYKVEVTLKSVDIKESFLCGYLRIEGLTKDHPTLTTYFEGEIIGSKYTFQTKHETWGATEKTDMQHWARFPAWRPLANQAKRSDFHYKNYMEKENIFMRWKEYFLVPDHRVREIHGASFEGFYYICFNQVKGTVSGIYFHSKSEKFQQLDLEFVPDMGGFAAIEFR